MEKCREPHVQGPAALGGMVKRAEVVLPDVVDVVAVLFHLYSLLYFRRDVFEKRKRMEKNNSLHRARRHDDAGEFITDALRGNFFEFLRMVLYRRLRGGVYRKIKVSRNPRRAHHTERVFGEAFLGVADRPHNFIPQILLPAVFVNYFVLVIIKCERVY